MTQSKDHPAMRGNSRADDEPARPCASCHEEKPASDGPRYKALGNSMAVPVMAWIGRRIEAVELTALSSASNPAPQPNNTDVAA